MVIFHIYFFLQCELPGFYDPCVGESKQLHIEYSWRDVKRIVVIGDTEELRLPAEN